MSDIVKQLPKNFINRMEKMLGDESRAFFASYETESAYGLRRNPLKCSKEEFERIYEGDLQPIPWEACGYYAKRSDHPGKHPNFDMGLYYIQEPSAMVPAAVLMPQKGEKVLDLCAAPGGKSTQLAGYLQNEGLLVANEIIPSRAKILSGNIERMGVKNAVVLNETPPHLLERFEGFFDKIMVDSPCSGEGMFKKEEAAINEWSEDNIKKCAARSKEIVDCAIRMLAPGGMLCYSTCTFAPKENESIVSYILTNYPKMRVIEPLEKDRFRLFSNGQAQWIEDELMELSDKQKEDVSQGLEKTYRIFPHKVRGEGHFVALFQKTKEIPLVYDNIKGNEKKKKKKQESKTRDITAAKDFLEEMLYEMPKGTPTFFSDEFYLLPEEMPALDGLKVVRAGLHIGTFKKGRFEPSHSLAMALKEKDVKITYEIKDPTAYFHGESIPVNEEHPLRSGWVLLTHNHFSIGWGKVTGNIIKNHYPKGLRK